MLLLSCNVKCYHSYTLVSKTFNFLSHCMCMTQTVQWHFIPNITHHSRATVCTSYPVTDSVWHTICQVSSTQEEERWHYHALGICVNPQRDFFPTHTSCSNMLVMVCHDTVSVYMMMIMIGKLWEWWWWWCPAGRKALLWVHSPSVQFSVASLFPSHILPRCLGAGELHSRLRCFSHWLLHTVHSLHSSQPPSTAIWGYMGLCRFQQVHLRYFKIFDRYECNLRPILRPYLQKVQRSLFIVIFNRLQQHTKCTVLKPDIIELALNHNGWK